MQLAEGTAQLITPEGESVDVLGGIETEYAELCETCDNKNSSDIALEVARKVHGSYSLAEDGSTMPQASQFTEDGQRIYLDHGVHPELATAEDTSFLDMAYRVLAGHVKMARLYAAAHQAVSEENSELKTTYLHANTCDTQGNSWGSHLNTLARRELDPIVFVGPLAAHRACRIVWSGALYVRPNRDHDDFTYCLSEKADHIWSIASLNTTHDRPLVNMRDESLAEFQRFRRIHDVSGETVFSPFVNGLRQASEAILQRALALGADFSDLLPLNPVRAIRQISSDITLKTTIELEKGGTETGVSLQRALAEKALSTAQKYLTAQEQQWGERWIAICDQLETDPDRCIRKLDWVVKHRLIERELENNPAAKTDRPGVAQAKALNYHQLLPSEGKGMELVRSGFFELSPSNEVLDQGLPLPNTRARVRGQGIRSLRAIDDQSLSVDWDGIGFIGSGDGLYVRLKDPYDTNTERVDALIERFAA